MKQVRHSEGQVDSRNREGKINQEDREGKGNQEAFSFTFQGAFKQQHLSGTQCTKQWTSSRLYQAQSRYPSSVFKSAKHSLKRKPK